MFVLLRFLADPNIITLLLPGDGACAASLRASSTCAERLP
jgi:hypothetical protein